MIRLALLSVILISCVSTNLLAQGDALSQNKNSLSKGQEITALPKLQIAEKILSEERQSGYQGVLPTANFLSGYKVKMYPGIIKHYKDAQSLADQGNVEYMAYVGNLYSRQMNLKEADKWMKKAADLGHAGAKEYLKPKAPGWGAGVFAALRGDDEEAIKNFQIGAEKGDVNAQYALGMMIVKAGDADKGMEWIKRAAAFGHKEAQFMVKMMENVKAE